jgi:hypothetical protein
MGIPEEKFWRMTMRKFNYLWKRHMEFKYPKTEVKVENKKREIGDNELVSIDEMDFI